MQPLPVSRLVLIIGILISSGTHAQRVQWAHKGISPGFEYGNGITTDDSGNVYVSGQIEYTTHFDGGIDLSSWGSHDIFVAKYAPDGSPKWMKSAGGHRGDVGYGVGVDAQHNCYITGEIEDTVYFGPNDSLVAVGSNDMFVAKYDLAGHLLWDKSFGSAGNDKGFAMSVKPNGDTYITGYFSGSIDFDNVHFGTSGNGDVYVLKLDASGNVAWAKKGGGTGADHGHGITYDRNNNIYVAGYFTEDASFSGNNVTTGAGVRSAFLARYDDTGHLDWIKSNCCDTTEYSAVAVDEAGNIYTTGYFNFSATIGATTLNTAGGADILIVKYDPSGNVIWAKQAGGPYEDIAYGISVDSINHLVYITGQLDDHGYFDSHYAGAAGNRDVFIAAYDYNGNCLWVRPYGGVQRDVGYAITNDNNGYILTTGIFFDNATFGNYQLTGDTLADYYVDKVSPAPVAPPSNNVTGMNSTSANCTDVNLTFNPGNGTGLVIIASAGSPVTQAPSDGSWYNASTVFGSGDDLGGGNFVVYNGTGSSVTVTGLSGGITYYFAAYEYNGTGGMTGYQTSNPAMTSLSTGANTVNIQATSNTFCEGDTATLTASGGSNYQWSPSAGLSSTTGSTVLAFPASTTTYTVTADNNGCQVSKTILITILPAPAVTFALIDSICVNNGPLTLNGGSPSGGIYSGPSVAAGVFRPGQAGAGTVTLTYTYTNGNGCSNSESSDITVVAAPNISLGNDTTICAGYSVVLNAGNGYASYLWSNGNTHASITIDSSGTGIGSRNIFVTVQNSFGCSNTDTVRVSFAVCAGIDETNGNPALHIYPNPFNASAHINLDSKGSVYIYDVTGKLVGAMLRQTGDVTFGNDLAPGLYMVIVEQEKYKSVFRLVKE